MEKYLLLFVIFSIFIFGSMVFISCGDDDDDDHDDYDDDDDDDEYDFPIEDGPFDSDPLLNDDLYVYIGTAQVGLTDQQNRLPTVLEYGPSGWYAHTFENYRRTKDVFSLSNGVLFIILEGEDDCVVNKYDRESWSQTAIIEMRHSGDCFLGLHFLDEDTGFVVGQEFFNGFVLYINGSNQELMSVPEYSGDWSLLDISMIDENIGWAVGRSGREGLIILKYENGKWKDDRQSLETEYYQLLSVDALNYNESWACGYNNYQDQFVLQHNYGAWEKQSLPLQMVQGCSELMDFYGKDLSFIDTDEGWMASRYDCKYEDRGAWRNVGLLYHYKNGLWEQINLPIPNDDPFQWEVSSVAFKDKDKGAALGNYGCLPIYEYFEGDWVMISTPCGVCSFDVISRLTVY